jgi:hypothetical protein
VDLHDELLSLVTALDSGGVDYALIEGPRSMKAPLDRSPAAVSARLRWASELSDLSIARAGEGKVSFEPAAVSARLRMVSQLRELGLRLRRAGAAADDIR